MSPRSSRPPEWPSRLLALCLPGDAVGESVAGDLGEEHERRAKTDGARAAGRWYRREALSTASWSLHRRLRKRKGAERPRGELMDTIRQDVRYAWRMLKKQPSFAAIVVATLALAIGVNTLIFTFVSLFALRPLPFKNIESLVYLHSVHPDRANDRVPNAYSDYLDWRRDSQTMDEIGALRRRTFSLTGFDQPMRVQGAPASASFFVVSGLTAVQGRLFNESEDRKGADPVVVLAHGFWERQLGAETGVLNQTIMLDGVGHTVVGVMTPEIELGNLSEIDLWTPVAHVADAEDRSLRDVMVIGRLAHGQTLDNVVAEMETVGQRLAVDHPTSHEGWSTKVLPLRTALVGRNAWLLLSLLGVAVSFVLAIACANVANLTLARATVRERETAVRAALGASRMRLVRQMLTEGAMLSIAGGALGVLLAALGLRVLVAFTFEPFYDNLELDARVLTFSAGISLLAPIIFGLLPALQASRRDLSTSLKEGGGRAVVGSRGGRGRRGLVVLQLSLAMILLVVAGLSIRTAIFIQDVDAGFDNTDVVTLQIDLPEGRYDTDEKTRLFYESLVAHLDRLPNVEKAAVASGIPTLNQPGSSPLLVEGIVVDQKVKPWAAPRQVSREFFDVLRLPVVEGRAFTESDGAGSEPVVIVTQALVDRYMPGGPPIGRRIKLAPPDSHEPWRRVVGVAGNTLNGNLRDAPLPVAYVPFEQDPLRAVVVIAKSSDTTGVVREARAHVAKLDPDQPIYNASTIDQTIYRETDGNRVTTGLFALFAAVALGMAAIGLYGVISYAVSRRIQEIGVRMALGAGSGDVVRMIVGQGASLIGLGLVAGLAGGVGMSRLLGSLLVGVSPSDPLTYITVTLALAVSAFAASFLPARRASRVDPIQALRVD